MRLVAHGGDEKMRLILGIGSAGGDGVEPTGQGPQQTAERSGVELHRRGLEQVDHLPARQPILQRVRVRRQRLQLVAVGQLGIGRDLRPGQRRDVLCRA